MKRAHNNLQQIGPVLIAKTVFECLHYQSATVAPIIKISCDSTNTTTFTRKTMKMEIMETYLKRDKKRNLINIDTCKCKV